MKRYLLSLMAFLCLFYMSCEDSRMEGMYDDKIGFLKNGEQMISAYIANAEIEFESAVYKSGIGKEGSTKVVIMLDEAYLTTYNEINNTSLKLLPQDSYTIVNKEFQLNHNDENPVVRIKVDVRKLEALQGVQSQEYALPLKLSTSGEIEVNSEQSNLILIPEITGGIRPNSAITLFNKTFAQMDINPTNHNTASFAVSTKYLFVNTRNEDLKYYDRFTGEYVGSIALPFKGSLTNFTITNDDKDNLLLTNLRNAATGLALQTIYRIKGTGLPEKYIELSHIYPNGRKLSITGDLDNDAIITSTVENSSRVLYWTVRNGVLISQEPQVYAVDAAKLAWATLADAVALNVSIDEGMFIAASGATSGLGFMDKEGQGVYSYDLLGGGLDPGSFRNQALSYTTFNGSKYLALGSQMGAVSMHTTLLDVTKNQNLQLDPNSQKLVAYKANIVTNSNVNATADIHLKVSNDQSTMEVYSLGTNGSITAVQFDSKLSD